MIGYIRRFLAVRPLEPFSIVMSSGQRYFVASHEHVSVHPSGSRVAIWFDDDSGVTVSALHVTAVEEGKPSEAVA